MALATRPHAARAHAAAARRRRRCPAAAAAPLGAAEAPAADAPARDAAAAAAAAPLLQRRVQPGGRRARFQAVHAGGERDVAELAPGDDSAAPPPPAESFEAGLLREAIARAAGLAEKVQVPVERVRWSKVRDALRPTQAALGFDWVFYKLKNFTSADAAQRYMDAKPVPYVLRGGKLFIVDHHHTLVALDLFCRSTGADPYVTLEQIRSFDQAGDSSLSAAAFWGFMEGKGWAFLRDAAYNRTPTERLPLDFVLSSFRNDVFRSMGGFARVFGLLRRGKELDDTLFFEFRWGYLFWLHRNDGFGLWPDKRLLRAFQRYVALIGEIDSEEYAEEVAAGALNVRDAIFLSNNVIEPAYQNLTLYLRSLCVAYDDLKGPARQVLGLRAIFGHDELPGKVIR